ncbi:MAG: hypothetical protein JXR25_16515 [Pontiellaceae bacterium]|nr:hypothetical protein [Pontiellaceae bacterium]MBN2786425.1 hypothetical protein [Pontiellaceae bacterium]
MRRYRLRMMLHGSVTYLLAALLLCLAPAMQASGLDSTVRSLASLSEKGGSGESIGLLVNIKGVVWWADPSDGRIILQDETAALQLDIDFDYPMPNPGDLLHLRGACSVIQSRDALKVAPVPVVDNNGLHVFSEQSGTIPLAAGKHPLRAVWFNRTDRFGLSIEIEGPGLPRRPVPSGMLFRMDIVDGATNWVNGLEYRCCEGQWWRSLPNFTHMAASGAGSVENFQLDVRTRADHVGLQFSGYISIPQDGDYTFYVSSDDGSRLFIGPSTLSITVGPGGRLPLAQSALLNDPGPDEAEYVWATVEGDVKSVHRSRDGLELELMTGAGLVRVKVAEDAPDSYTLHPGNRIRVVGASRRIRNLDDRWMRAEFFVQRWSDIEQLTVSPALWSEYPVIRIEEMAGQSKQLNGSVVHIRGRVLPSLEDSGRLCMEDDSGVLLLGVGEAATFEDHFIDLLGRMALDGTRMELRNTYGRLSGRIGGRDSLPELTSIEQVYQLTLEEAARKYPVRVRGVITSPMESDGAVIQDASRGIYVVLGGPINLQIGDYCEIEGVTGPYQFSQYIDASRVEVIGAGNLPEPVRPTWDQLINGSLHCNYVELEGVVTDCGGNFVTLLTRGGRINVRLNPAGPAVPENAVGATVRLRGCLLADWDGDSYRVEVGSIYLDQHWIAVVHPAPIDPFSIPLKRVEDLLSFDPRAGALQRVKVSGHLVHNSEGLGCLMDGRHGLRFISVGAVEAVPGDVVDVVGFLELGGPSPVIREAMVRRTAPDEMPMPLNLEVWNLLEDEHDATFVRIEGVLLDVSVMGGKTVLEMQKGLRRFVAELAGDHAVDDLVPGSRLVLSGTYLGLGGNRVLGRPVDSFKLLLNGRSDIFVVSSPPWWTLKRMLNVIGFLGLVLLAALVWIKMLRRKVDARTEELGNEIRERQRAERERQIEQERARLAHDLHDDLGARLTEVNMLASLVKSPATSTGEKKAYAGQLNDIAQQMVTSLDEIVWAVNPRNDTVPSMAGYFGAHAQRILELASVGCGLDISEELPDVPVDPHFRQEIFLAFKEALSNVIRHAKASKVWLRMGVEEDNLVVTVSDDGCGMESDKRAPGADGLANMRERMQALGGTCRIDSSLDTGTVVRLAAPLRRLT